MKGLDLARVAGAELTRGSSDSDASSDREEGQDSSSCDDFASPEATPRPILGELNQATPDTTPEQPGQREAMKPKVPILGLKEGISAIARGPADQSTCQEGQPKTARGRPPVPGLAFRQEPEVRAAPSLPPMAPAAYRQGRSGEQRPARATPGAQADAAVSVSLISQGLSVLSNKPERSIGAEAALNQISRQLGIRQAELKLYRLTEVEGQGCSLASEAGQYAVAVKDSRFSLTSVEKVLVENATLKSQAEKGNSELDSAKKLALELNTALAAVQQAKGAQECQLEALKARCQLLERETTVLKDQLRRSLAVQTQGRLALDDMRAEFQRLTQQLAARKKAPSLASQEASDTAGAPSAPSTHLQQYAPTARPSGMSCETQSPIQTAKASQQDRIANVLEKLCDEAVLLRLESCLGQREN